MCNLALTYKEPLTVNVQQLQIWYLCYLSELMLEAVDEPWKDVEEAFFLLLLLLLLLLLSTSLLSLSLFATINRPPISDPSFHSGFNPYLGQRG